MQMRIERIEAFPVRYPTLGRFKFFEGPDGRPLGRAAVIVKITADEGNIGWGEAVPVQKWSYETLEASTSTIERYLAPVLLGADPFDLHDLHERMNHAIAPGFSTGMPKSKAGIDIAVHDLITKKLGISLAEYWGRPRGDQLTLSWTLNPVHLDDLDRLMEEGRQRGYKNFNVKVAPDPKADLELCRRVKERAPDGFLWADANCGYDLATCLAVAPRLADIGVAVLESPFRPNEISSYRRLKQQGALPILMDEGVIAPRDLMEFIRLEMLDGVAMKPARCGGLLPARRQIEILLDAGLMMLGSGLTDPDVSLAASLALFGAYGLAYPAALNGPQFLGHSVLRVPLVSHDGCMSIPSGPGLGIDVDEAKIQTIAAAG